ncbi:MAG: Copper amine oxidase N-terminal domain, partial [Armatimonadetes bacterium]|nr:Copper amine oxidase N-terminal domain [Armatimonadota bacterium]
MRRTALGKHRWSVVPGLLLCITAAGPIYAAPERASTQIAIGNPLPNSLVAGRISLSVAYNPGMGQITALTVFVDDKIQFSRNVLVAGKSGIQYLDLDTRTMQDGNHIVKVVAMGLRGPLAIDEVGLTVRNGIAGGLDLVPPLVQLRGLQDGDTVSGKLALDVLAEDNSGMDLLVSVFVNRFPRLIKSSPPYSLELNTAEFLDPLTKSGTLTVEAWAYDRANNLGKSRKLTLKVEAADAINATIKKEDPTLPKMADPLPQVGELKAPAPMVVEGDGSLDVTLAVPPKALPGSPEGTSVTKPLTSLPAGKPMVAPAPAKGSLKIPGSAHASAGGQGTLSGSKTTTPEQGRPTAQPLTPSGTVKAPPQPATTSSGAPTITGQREVKPGTPTVTVRPVAPKVTVVTPAKPKVTPAPKLQRMASIPHRAPEIVPPASAKAVAPVTQPIDMAADILDRAGDVPEMGAPAAVPVPSTGLRAQTPAVRPGKVASAAPTAKRAKPLTQMAKATPASKQGMTLVVVDKNRRDRKGNPKVDIYHVNDRPVDRSYTVGRGESMHAIARKFKVTVKAIQVANALADGHGLRAGSIIKVPGTFDVVMNDKRVAFDVTPRVENGLALTPFRQIMEYAGGTVVWYPEGQEVRAANEKADIKIKIGSKEAFVNQTVIVMDREAFLDSGRTM